MTQTAEPSRATPDAAAPEFSSEYTGEPRSCAEVFGSMIDTAQRVVVTGGSGFIGSNVVALYKAVGAPVINIDKELPRKREDADVWHECDICDLERYRRIVREFEPDVFLHLAARTDLDESLNIAGYAANTRGVENTLRIIDENGSIQRLVMTSSQLVCRPGYKPRDENDYAPHTMYGESKILTELFTRRWKNPRAVPWVIVRPTSIWGPWFDIPYKTFFLEVARRRYFHQHGKNPLRSFGFVGNCVYEYVRLSQVPAESIDKRTLYMADFDNIRVRDWANLIQREMGIRALREVPMTPLVVAANIGDMLQKMGWKHPPLTTFRLTNLTSDNVNELAPTAGVVGPLPYGFEEGVRMTVRWLFDQGEIPQARPIGYAGK